MAPVYNFERVSMQQFWRVHPGTAWGPSEWSRQSRVWEKTRWLVFVGRAAETGNSRGLQCVPSIIQLQTYQHVNVRK